MLYFSIESTNFLVKKLTTQNFWRSSYLDISFYFGAFFFYRKYQFFGEKIDNSKFLEELIPWHFILFWCKIMQLFSIKVLNFSFKSPNRSYRVPIFLWKNWQLKIFGEAHTLTFHFILVQNYAIVFDKSIKFFCQIPKPILSRVWVSSAIWFLIL